VLGRTFVISLPILILLALSWARITRTKSWSAVFQLLGAGCLIVVALAHMAEALHWFPAMGWGQRDSVGHYIDFVSATGGLLLLSMALILAYIQGMHW
jgi:hypothetical protein